MCSIDIPHRRLLRCPFIYSPKSNTVVTFQLSICLALPVSAIVLAVLSVEHLERIDRPVSLAERARVVLHVGLAGRVPRRGLARLAPSPGGEVAAKVGVDDYTLVLRRCQSTTTMHLGVAVRFVGNYLDVGVEVASAAFKGCGWRPPCRRIGRTA